MIEKQRTFSRKREIGRKKLPCESIVLTKEMGAGLFEHAYHTTETKSRSKEDRWASKSKNRENNLSIEERRLFKIDHVRSRFFNHSTDRERWRRNNDDENLMFIFRGVEVLHSDHFRCAGVTIIGTLRRDNSLDIQTLTLACVFAQAMHAKRAYALLCFLCFSQRVRRNIAVHEAIRERESRRWQPPQPPPIPGAGGCKDKEAKKKQPTARGGDKRETAGETSRRRTRREEERKERRNRR